MKQFQPLPYSVYHYRGSLPGIAEVADIWSTPVHGRMTATAGIHRLRVDVSNSGDGTFNLYSSQNGGTTWRLVSATAITAAATTAKWGAIVESFYDWRLEWVNGAAAQTRFDLDLSFHYDRSAPGDEAGGGPPPPGDFLLDDLNSGGGGVNDVIEDDLNSGGGGVNDPITLP